MKQKIIDFFKSFTLYDILYITLSLIAITVVSIVFKSDALSIVYSFTSTIGLFILSKGNYLGYVLILAYMIVYAVQSYLQTLYGEAILYGFVLVPLQIYAIIKAFRRKNVGGSIQITRLKAWQYALSLAVVLAIGFGIYFGLQVLGTKYLIVSTISFMVALYANFLRTLGDFNCSAVFLALDIVTIVLWLMPVFYGEPNGTSFIPIAVTSVIYIVNDIYTYINWIKLYKKQKKEKGEENGTTSTSG